MRWWLSIGAALLLATGLALRYAADAPWLLAAVRGYPIALLGAVVLLAWRFERSRLAWAALLAGAAWATLSLLPVADWPRVIAPLGVLLPLAILALAAADDHALASPRGLLQGVLLLGATSVGVALVAAPIPSFESAFALLRALPAPDASLRLSRVALLAFALATVLVACVLAWRRRPAEAGLLLLLPALLMMLAARDVGPARAAWALAAGGVLALATLESAFALAYHDELTGLPTRRALGSMLRGLRVPYAIGVADIDRFKSVNDTYGHETGDQVLRMVAARLARVRDGRVYRTGGEEFTLVFPGLDTVEAYRRIDEVRADVEAAGFRLRAADRPKKATAGARRRGSAPATREDGDVLAVTVSAGVADERDGADPELVMAAADRALYTAKRNGRNRVIAAGRRRVPAAG